MSEEYKNTLDQDFTPNIEQIGASTNPFQHQTEALKARIFHGASRVEFSFFGADKTNKEQPGPESFGRRERQDMRDLAVINKVQTSTHATVGIQGLAGFDGQNGFSSEKQQKSFDELRKAIDFASEASTGGAVVFHTGDGPRSMWSHFNEEFKSHHMEHREEIHYLVDPEEKKMIGAVKEDSFMFIPTPDTNPDGTDKFVLDENGNPVLDEITKRPIPIFKQSAQGDIETKKVYFRDFKEGKEAEYKLQGRTFSNGDLKKEVVRDFFKLQQEFQIQYQLGQAREYLSHYKRALKDRSKITDALNYYKDLKEKLPKEEWENNFIQKSPEHGYGGASQFTIPDKIDPVEYLKEKLDDNVRQIGYGKEIALSGIRQAQEANDRVKNAVFLDEYALEQSNEQMAKAAIYAYDKTQERIRKGDDVIKKNPLYISPEGWRPEDYGSHPDEIKKMVQGARKVVIEKLKNTYGEIKAKKIAEQTIKATIDIGHLNTWRRFYVRKEGESEEKFDKRFKQWVLKKSKDLAENGIVGHVHLSDNFGYHDEHLTVGDGNAPVKEFIKVMRDNGVDEFIVEGGSFNPLTALPDTWNALGSPIYRVGAPAGGSAMDTWGNFHQGYFGQTEGPRYVVGEYAPSEDFKGSPFYTGTPLE